MDIQKVKELALANGFKLKEQASGNMDLNAYVYDFANAIEREVRAQADQKIKSLLCDEHLKKCESPTGIFNSQYPDEEPCLISLAKEAKAQAVPEGFVLIKASDRDQEMLELIDQRDYMESQAEELKDKLQTLYGVNFGEHSSCNFPFQNAIDYDDSDLVSVKKNHLSEVIEKIERMFEEDPLLALGELLPIQQGIKAMIEAQEPAND